MYLGKYDINAVYLELPQTFLWLKKNIFFLDV